MAFKSKDEIMEILKAKYDGVTDDDTLELIEDISDTYDELVSRAAPSEDWKRKYEENDKMWREKYKARFFNEKEEIEDVKDFEKEKEDSKPQKFEDLFREEKLK